MKPHQATQIGDNYYQYDGNGNVVSIGNSSAVGDSPAPNSGGTIIIGENRYFNSGTWAANRLADGGSGGVADSSTIYILNEENRLLEAKTAGDTVRFGYDAGGQRVYKKSGLNETIYSDKMYSVRVSTNPYVEQKHIYLNGDRLLTKLGRNDKTAGDNSYQRLNQYYNHANHIGSVNVITDHQGREFS